MLSLLLVFLDRCVNCSEKEVDRSRCCAIMRLRIPSLREMGKITLNWEAVCVYVLAGRVLELL